MTFLQLQQYASDLLDDTSNGYFTLPMLKMRLNLAQRELQKRLISANQQWYSTCVTANTVVDQEAYSLPTDFLELIRLSFISQGSGTTATYQPIQFITPNQVDLIVDQSGDPYWYVIEQDNLILKPTPNRIVSLHLQYAYSVVDMVLDADIPDAPEQFHEYIAILATRDCLIKDGRPMEPIKYKLETYEVLLKQLAVQRRADGPRMVVSTTSWDGV